MWISVLMSGETSTTSDASEEGEWGEANEAMLEGEAIDGIIDEAMPASHDESSSEIDCWSATPS
jgi:hypothetical protein